MKIIHDKITKTIAEALKRYYKYIKNNENITLIEHVLDEYPQKESKYLLLTSYILEQCNTDKNFSNTDDFTKNIINYLKDTDLTEINIFNDQNIIHDNDTIDFAEVELDNINIEGYKPYQQPIGHLGGSDDKIK